MIQLTHRVPVAAERRPPTMTFVTLDRDLRTAAAREGFVVQELSDE